MISVIVPVYNAERYLRKCIDSILNQTFKDFEILLVDDGSTDKSGVICDEFAQKDKRICVFHKENEGIASTRQFGMDHARGEFVIHVDPDDWVEPDMLEELYNEAVDKNADVVICDYWVNNERIVKQQPSSLDNLTVLKELFQQLYGSCWNKFLRRSCYLSYQIQFYKELTYCEDLTFWVRLFQHSVIITYLPKAFYHYIQHPKSLCKTHMAFEEDRDWKLIKILKKDLSGFNQIKKLALSRLSFIIVEDAFLFGNFTSLSFTKRYYKYIPYILVYKKRTLLQRFYWMRVCLGMYGYYKKRN